MAISVACIGNMNNNFFTLVRLLRDRGINAHLLLRNNEFDHFHPRADTYSDDYIQYTKQLSWGHVLTYYTTPKSTILRDLSQYDILITCGTTLAFLNKVNAITDIFSPYGADLYGFPFCKFPLYLPIFWQFCNNQKKAIQKSKMLLMEITGSCFEDSLNEIGFSGKHIPAALPMVYTKQYHPEMIASYYTKSKYYNRFKDIKQNHGVMLFHHTRLNWSNVKDPVSHKGNDILIKGFADYVKKNSSSLPPALILFEYGDKFNITATKKLINDLGIEKNVHWFKKLERKEIMVGLSLADIATAEFHHSWICGGTIYESLSMGKPLMQIRDDSLYATKYSSLYPIINVKNRIEVRNALTDFIHRPDHYKMIGEKGQLWHQENIIDDSMDNIIRSIMELYSRKQG